MHILSKRLIEKKTNVDDASGCGSGECGDDPSSLVVAAVVAVERFALVKRQQFSRCAVAVDSADASCDKLTSDADSVGLGCEEIDGLKQCR